MTPSKIGVHVVIGPRKNYGIFLQTLKSAGARLPVVKCVDDFSPAREAKDTLGSTNVLTVGRLNTVRDAQGNRRDLQGVDPVTPTGMLAAGPVARDYYELVRPIWEANRHIDVWETFNEMSAHWAWQGEFFVAMMDLAERDGFTLAIYSCSTGNPPDQQAIEKMKDACGEAERRGHYLALHEYGGVAPPKHDGGWPKTLRGSHPFHALRYRDTLAALWQWKIRPRILLTEVGQAGGFDFIDRLTGHGPGSMRRDLEWYDDQLAHDDEVIAAAMYTLGNWHQANFQAALLDLGAHIVRRHRTSPNPDPKPDPLPSPRPARGAPRTQYTRTYLLLPNEPTTAEGNARLEAWMQAAVASGVIGRNRWTIGASADDAGIGDLDARNVIAVNPQSWPGDLRAFYAQHYPGIRYGFIPAVTPDDLYRKLASDADEVVWPDDESTPTPPLPSRGAPLVGLHLYAGAGGVRDVDFEVLSAARIQDTVLITTNSGPDRMQRLIDFGILPANVVLRLHVDWPGDRMVDPIEAYKWFGLARGAPGNPDDYPLEWFRRLGGKKYIVFNEPNHEDEGFGVQWKNAADFISFYADFAALALRDYPELDPGLPALSPRPDVVTDWIPAYRTVRAYARWVSAHCYWTSESLMTHREHGFYWQHYTQIGLPVHITEASNPNGEASSSRKAAEYVRYVEELKKAGFDGMLHFYVSSSTHDADFERNEPWANRRGQLTEIPAIFGLRKA